MTALIIVSCFLSLMLVQFVGFKVGKAWATKQGVKEIAAPPSGFKCPYCRIDVTGVRDIDLINHSLCITRSEEELDKLRVEAKNVPQQDEYFVDVRTYVYSTPSKVPGKHKNCWYWDKNVDARVDEATVYRNGEAFNTVYGQGAVYTRELGERLVTIDKQKRKAEAKA